MMYLDYVGMDYKFKKGERVPQWLFESNVMFFGTNTLVIPLKDKVFIFGKPTESEALIHTENYNAEKVIQVCPQISLYTDLRV